MRPLNPTGMYPPELVPTLCTNTYSWQDIQNYEAARLLLISMPPLKTILLTIMEFFMLQQMDFV